MLYLGTRKKGILSYRKRETRNKDVHLTNRDTDKAKQFNAFFASVFNTDDGVSISFAKNNNKTNPQIQSKIPNKQKEFIKTQGYYPIYPLLNFRDLFCIAEIGEWKDIK